MTKYYLRLEAVNLSNFVYDSKDLSTIRGGGLLLLNAVDWVVNQIHSPSLTPLMTGASAGLYEFEVDEPDKALKVCIDIQNYLASHPQLKHATFVVDVKQAQGEQQFNADHEMVIAKNRWRQMQSPTISIPAHNENLNVEPCVIDRVRPGSATIWGPENKVLQVSESIAQRCDYGRDQKKQEFYREQSGRAIECFFTRDLGDLTDDPGQGNLHHKMAVIYLDGNSFGKVKKANNAGLTQQKGFDDNLKKCRQQMLQKLLDRIEEDDRWKIKKDHICYRLETLLWGGDEIIWVVPAWKAWEILSFFFSESKQWQFSGQLHHAGGMVLCHHNAPIHRIKALAQQLAELAKEKDRTRSLFAYEVLESFDHIGRDIKTYRIERCPQPLDPKILPDPNLLILAGDDMPEIQSKALVLKEKLPRRKLHAMVENLLTKTQSTDQTTTKSAQRIKLTEDLCRSLDDEESKNALTQLMPKLGGGDAGWLHLSTLWDYLV